LSTIQFWSDQGVGVHQRQVVKDDTSLSFDNPAPTFGTHAIRTGVGLAPGAAYFIPTVHVPAVLWQAWEDDVEGQSLDAGHFFPEEAPGPTADTLKRFLKRH
jgi:hypothetical protein